MKIEDKQRIHELHEKYYTEGLSAMTEAEKTELLFTYSSNKFTEYAQVCSKRYLSLKDTMSADYNILIKKMKLNDQTVTLLRLIPQLSRIIKNAEQSTALDSSEASIQYFKKYFCGVTNEIFVVACLNEAFNIISLDALSEGTAYEVEISCGEICGFAHSNCSSKVIIAHNHPLASAEPSSQDRRTTQSLFNRLKYFGITLTDHIIIGLDSAVSFRRLPRTMFFNEIRNDGYDS